MNSDGGERRCQGEKADGSPCEAPATVVDPDSGYCPAHDPDREQERHERAKAGGQATARLHRGRLTSDELPPLDNPQAAEEWLETVSRALMQDRISRSKADVIRKAVKDWRKIHEAGQLSDRLERLTDAVAEVNRTGDLGPLLKVVDGELS